MPKILKSKAFAFLILGLIIVLPFSLNLNFLIGSQTTIGIVKGHKYIPDSKFPQYLPMVIYEVNGREYEIKGANNSLKTGDEPEVVYKLDNPQNAIILTFVNLVNPLMAGLCLFIGFVWVAYFRFVVLRAE